MLERWLEGVIEKASQREGVKVVETGITPSGPLHMGHLRELAVGNAIFEGLKKKGLKSQFIYVSDDFDALRRLYPFLPKSFEKYVCQPLSKIPPPAGGSKTSYAEYYFTPFLEALKNLGVTPEIYRATELYKKGTLKEAIKIALSKKEKIRRILEKVSGYKLSKNWSPYRPWCKKCKRIGHEVKILEENLENYQVNYQCVCGYKGTADFSKGEGKLQWRVDWPARWFAFKVTVEPYGKEHAVAGGSYDTAALISQEVFGWQPPIGVPYEFLYLRGVKGKMSSSLGNVMAAPEILKLLTPDLVKNLLLRNIERHLEFDPVQDVLQLWEESGFPFKHLLTIIQASQGNFSEIKRLIKQSGHQNLLKDEKLLKENLERINYWLENFAPEEFKFEIQKKTPPQILKKLTGVQKQLLKEIVRALADGKRNQELHNFIYEAGKKLGLTPKQTFEPIYLVLLGKTSGPKAGFFLSILPPDFVAERLKNT